MATRKLSERDEKIINDLLGPKSSFFFKERSKVKKHGKRGGDPYRASSFGVGFNFNSECFGLYFEFRGRQYRFGYSADISRR